MQFVGMLAIEFFVTRSGEVLVNEQRSMLQVMPLQQVLADRFVAGLPDLEEIGCRVASIGEFNLNLSDGDEQRLKQAQSEIGAAKRAARVANIGVAEAEAQARQRQFELDQNFQNDARYVQNLAGGDYARYAAGKAMVGAGEGMAQGGGGDGGAMTGGAALGVGFGMAQAMGQQFAQPPTGGGAASPAPTTGQGQQVACPNCSARVPGGKFCAECGSELAPKPRFCSACGQPGASGAKFCAECGTAFPQG